MHTKKVLFQVICLIVVVVFALSACGAKTTTTQLVGDEGVAKGYKGSVVKSVPQNLVKGCQKEGMLRSSPRRQIGPTTGKSSMTSRQPPAS